MIGLGLDLSLRNYATGISYVKANRVLDLTTPFSELTFTLEDKSGEGNDATLYSGRYISTDGSTDRGIVADCSAAGAGSYYLTGKVRPNAVTTAELTMDGSTDSGLTGLTADVWQTFTTATSALTPSAVQVGYDGSTASAADWSDVKLIDSSDGSTVARWQLNESADGDLNGYPALDSVGGYHGTHTGCAGGTGETTILQTAGMDWNKGRYYDGATEFLVSSSNSVQTGDFTFETTIINDKTTFTNLTAISGNGFLDGAASGFGFFLDTTTGNIAAQVRSAAQSASIVSSVSATSGVPFRLKLTWVEATNTATLFINDASSGTATNALVTRAANPTRAWHIAESPNTSILNFGGLIYDVKLDGADIETLDTFTATGTPSNFLIPESDTTAGEDALGNAIAEPRPTAATFNFFGDGEYARIADADSLDLTTEATWEIWGNFYGAVSSNKTLIAKTDITNGTRSWQFLKDITDQNDELSFALGSPSGTFGIAYRLVGLLDATAHIAIIYDGSGATALDKFKIYVNGSPATVVVNTGTAPTSLFVSTSDVSIGARSNAGVFGNYQDKKISRPKIYNRALTADEVLKNYNAQKSSFGL